MNIIKYSEITENFYKFQEFEGIDTVPEIISYVKNFGDDAVRKYSSRFGDGDLETLEVSEEEIRQALEQVPGEVKSCIEKAVKNVKSFAKQQLAALKELNTEIDGAKLGHRLVPVQKVGAYVPGGNYPLPSSAVMSVIPAKVAGVEEVIVCSPKIHPATIAAAKIAGADKIFRIGGVQSVAAMAYGTESVPKVDMIVGPGNKYVTAAKKEVYGVCGIDFLAGPSEVMIIADDTAKPEFIAADMLAQAEHDPDARAYLITSSEKLAKQVQEKVNEFLNRLKTADIAKLAIGKSWIIIVENIEQAIEISDKKAPEHLEICYEGAEQDIEKYKNYGSLFIGNNSAEVFGDYCSGTNHILPTNGVARYTGGLSVLNFVKVQTYQIITQNSIDCGLSKTASKLAETEGLFAHKLSADLRSKE